LERMLQAINKKTKVIFIANPNNPTGTFIEKNEIVRFLEKVPKNLIVLLDQAYFDYSNYEREEVLFDVTDIFPNLVMSRTFSKAYGLAGLRVGYSVCSEKIANFLNRVRQPFNVNFLALKAAEVALGDKEHLKKSLELNKKEKEELYKFFLSFNYDFIETFANFICFDSKENSKTVFHKLMEKGIIVRPMEVYKMPNHIRVTIGLPSENSAFMDSLSKIQRI